MNPGHLILIPEKIILLNKWKKLPLPLLGHTVDF